MSDPMLAKAAENLFELCSLANLKGAVLIMFEQGKRTMLPMGMTPETAAALEQLVLKLQNILSRDDAQGNLPACLN